MRALHWRIIGWIVAGAVVACSADSSTVVGTVDRVSLVAVKLTSAQLTVGEVTQATASLKDASGVALTGKPVTWASSNSVVAAVDGTSGMVTAQSAGSTTITAASEGVTGAASVIVLQSPASVAAVTVSLLASSINVGSTTQASAITTDVNGNSLSDRSVVWTSSNLAVALVDAASGAVIGVGPGSASITGVSEGVVGSATLTVVALSIPVAHVAVSLASSSINVSATTQGVATVTDGNGNVLSGRAVAWTTSNPAVATVDPAAGSVIGVGAGSATITATCEGKTGSAVVSVAAVIAPVATVTPSLASSSISVGATTQATATTRDASNNLLAGRVITWSSSDAAVATVGSSSGVVTGVAIGTALIAATSEGQTGHATVTVIALAPPTASSLAIAAQPSASVQSGVVFAQQPIIQLRDASNNAVSKAGVVVTTAIVTGGGTLGGTTTATSNASGVATFTNLAITGAAGGRTLSFTASGLTSAASGTITVTVSSPAAATQVTITTQPSASAQSGVVFAQQPVVQLRDASNNAVSQAAVVVTAVIASGGVTLGGTTTATTNASGVATFTNLAITGTAGGRTLSFTAPGLTSAVSGTITVTTTAPPVPPPGAGEPVYDATSATLVMRDNMDEYTDATSSGALPLGTTPRLVPLPSPITTSQPVSTTANQVIAPGRGGTGKAIRGLYPGQTTTQHSANFLSYNTVAQPTMATHYFQYWARVNVAGSMSGALAVKWFEAWHFHGDRVQWNTHDHLPCPTNSQSTYWQVYDKGVATTCQGNQPVGPYFKDIIDNQWHRFTYSYRPNTSTGSRDGFARMWVDGTKVIDISAATIGVTPTGGEKPWCLADDVDALAVADGINYVEWGSAQTTSSPAWTYDIDDFLWWTTP